MQRLCCLYGKQLALFDHGNRLVGAHLACCALVCTGRVSCHEQVVTLMQFGYSLQQKLCHADVLEVVRAFAGIDFLLRSLAAIIVRPLAQTLTEVVAVPEPAVEHRSQLLIPFGNLCLHLCLSTFYFRLSTLLPHLHRLAVATHHRAHILRSARTTFDLQHAYAGIQHLIQKMYCLQVFGRHDILVVHLQFDVRRLVFYHVCPPADLRAGSAVSRTIQVVQREVTLTADRHT